MADIPVRLEPIELGDLCAQCDLPAACFALGVCVGCISGSCHRAQPLINPETVPWHPTMQRIVDCAVNLLGSLGGLCSDGQLRDAEDRIRRFWGEWQDHYVNRQRIDDPVADALNVTLVTAVSGSADRLDALADSVSGLVESIAQNGGDACAALHRVGLHLGRLLDSRIRNTLDDADVNLAEATACLCAADAGLPKAAQKAIAGILDEQERSLKDTPDDAALNGLLRGILDIRHAIPNLATPAVTAVIPPPDSLAPGHEEVFLRKEGDGWSCYGEKLEFKRLSHRVCLNVLAERAGKWVTRDVLMKKTGCKELTVETSISGVRHELAKAIGVVWRRRNRDTSDASVREFVLHSVLQSDKPTGGGYRWRLNATEGPPGRFVLRDNT